MRLEIVQRYDDILNIIKAYWPENQSKIALYYLLILNHSYVVLVVSFNRRHTSFFNDLNRLQNFGSNS